MPRHRSHEYEHEYPKRPGVYTNSPWGNEGQQEPPRPCTIYTPLSLTSLSLLRALHFELNSSRLESSRAWQARLRSKRQGRAGEGLPRQNHRWAQVSVSTQKAAPDSSMSQTLLCSDYFSLTALKGACTFTDCSPPPHLPRNQLCGIHFSFSSTVQGASNWSTRISAF